METETVSSSPIGSRYRHIWWISVLSVLILSGASFAVWKYLTVRPEASGATADSHLACDTNISKAKLDQTATHIVPSGPSSPPVIISTPASGPVPEGMVWIPAGEFSMGTDEPAFTDARPIHRVALMGFWMDKTEVTNREFEKFAKATRYVTVAERIPRAEDFPGAPPENLVAGSVVFSPPSATVMTATPVGVVGRVRM